jgi:hypothetical protein
MLYIESVVRDEQRLALFSESKMVGRKLIHDHEWITRLRDYGRDRALPWSNVQVKTGHHIEIVGSGNDESLILLLF